MIRVKSIFRSNTNLLDRAVNEFIEGVYKDKGIIKEIQSSLDPEGLFVFIVYELPKS